MPKKKVADIPTNEQLALRGIDYFNKKAAIKELETQCKELRGSLENAVDVMGYKTDKGSKVLALPHPDKDIFLKKTLRVGKVLLPEAVDVLRKNGLSECVEEVPVIREDVLERLYKAGKVSDEILGKVYGTKESFAFSVDVKERSDV